MGLVGKILTGATVFAGGVIIGTGLVKDNDYKITRSGDTAFLKDRETKKEYVITKAQDETYLGNAAHNFKGAFVLGAQEINSGKVSADTLEQKFFDTYRGGQ